jgi:hypothetical protein
MNIIEMCVQMMIAVISEIVCLVSVVALVAAIAGVSIYLYYTRDTQ